MDREAAVFDALRALTYSEMIAFAATLRDIADCQGYPGSDAEEWAALIQTSIDAYDDREGEP